MSRTLRERIKNGLVRSNGWPVCGWMNQRLTRALGHIACRRLALAPGVDSVLVRHSFNTRDYQPWQSDIDIGLVLEPGVKIPEGLKAITQTYRSVRRFIPIVGELEMFSRDDLRLWAAWGGISSLEIPSWQNYGGRPVPLIPLPANPALARNLDAAMMVEVMSHYIVSIYNLVTTRREKKEGAGHREGTGRGAPLSAQSPSLFAYSILKRFYEHHFICFDVLPYMEEYWRPLVVSAE